MKNIQKLLFREVGESLTYHNDCSFLKNFKENIYQPISLIYNLFSPPLNEQLFINICINDKLNQVLAGGTRYENNIK